MSPHPRATTVTAIAATVVIAHAPARVATSKAAKHCQPQRREDRHLHGLADLHMNAPSIETSARG